MRAVPGPQPSRNGSRVARLANAQANGARHSVEVVTRSVAV
jgi:hypothetical protein